MAVLPLCTDKKKVYVVQANGSNCVLLEGKKAVAQNKKTINNEIVSCTHTNTAEQLVPEAALSSSNACRRWLTSLCSSCAVVPCSVVPCSVVPMHAGVGHCYH